MVTELVNSENCQNMIYETKINEKLALNVRLFNPMETDCLRPQIRDKWEVEIEQSIARTNSIVRDKGNTAYARFKWFKRDFLG